MVIAESVFDQHDVLLAKEGTSLSERHIKVFKSWGIGEVCVAGESEEQEKDYIELEKRAKASVEKELNEKFRDVLDDRVMVEIMRVAGKHLVKRALDKET